MAEVIGVAASAVTLAALFSNCIDCFSYFKAAQNCSAEAETLLVKLDQLRVTYSIEYWVYRMGTSAVGVMVSLIDYANKVKVPYSIMGMPDTRILSDESNTIISISNDIISLKKEIEAGIIDSLIPLSCIENKDAQLATTAAAASLQASIDRFETTMNRMLCKTSESTVLHDHIPLPLAGIK
ncbi:hypothetical protein MMC30_002402 [Trapelia coarctata]|nr:hypothetical protein [Trapelia coarctata]